MSSGVENVTIFITRLKSLSAEGLELSQFYFYPHPVVH